MLAHLAAAVFQLFAFSVVSPSFVSLDLSCIHYSKTQDLFLVYESMSDLNCADATPLI